MDKNTFESASFFRELVGKGTNNTLFTYDHIKNIIL